MHASFVRKRENRKHRAAMTSVLVCASIGFAACDRAPSRVAARIAALDPPSAPGALSPNLTSSGDHALLTWIEPGGQDGGKRVRFSELAESGWTAPSTIAEGATIIANWVDVPSAVRQSASVLVAHWSEGVAGRAEASDVIVARSSDAGATWQRLGALHRDHTPTEHGFVSLLPDGDSVLAFWLDGRDTIGGGATSLRTARITSEVGNDDVIDMRVCDCCSTSATATASGPVVTYRDRSDDELRDPAAARRVGSAWTQRPVHADGWKINGCPVNGPASASRDATMAVAWFTSANEQASIRLAFSSDAGATFGPPISIDERSDKRTPLGRVDVSLLDSGDAIVSWLAATGDRAELLARRVARGGDAGRELSVATLARDSGFPRMERVRDDLLFVWSDKANRQLRLVRLAAEDIPRVGVR
jgi:hypothetical protein